MRPTMGQIFNKIWDSLHPTISRQKALKIAQKQCMPPIEAFEIYDSQPSGWCIYGLHSEEACWYVRRSSGTGMLSSAHAIIISKKTGRVIYDGSANDEG